MKNIHSKKRKDEKLNLSPGDVHLLILLLDGSPPFRSPFTPYVPPDFSKEVSDIKERLHAYLNEALK